MENLKPREKALNFGISTLNDAELLALIIKSGYKGKDVFKLANEIIDKANGFNNLVSYSFDELVNIDGLGKAKALELLAIIEICKRLTKLDKIHEEDFSSPDELASWIRFNLAFSNQEEFFVVYVNNRGNVVKSEILFKGSSNQATVGLDEILRRAILLRVGHIVVAHNHPGGRVSPSKEDVELTNKLRDSCKLMNIRLLDHIIVTVDNYFSFRKNGLL